MEIINYFETPRYNSVNVKRNVKDVISSKEIVTAIKTTVIHSVEFISKHKLISMGILCVYGFLMMMPFIHETSMKYLKTVELSAPLETEMYILSNAMEEFVMAGGVQQEGEAEFLTDDLGATLPQILQPVTYSTYKVRSGDNITNIARRFGLANISTLIAVNNISNVRLLQADKVLKIPSMDGITHTVANGESLKTIAGKYDITLEQLLDANDLSSDIIKKGDVLFIPGARMDSSSLRDAMGESFKMPVKAKWRLTSPYGYRADPFTGQRKFHTGIDMAAPLGTSIYAAMAGKVATTGYNNVFGNYIIISHGNGYQSLYAHLKQYTVRAGQFVDQGAKIGLMGSTGYSTGSHLHLSIYKNGKHVNPAPLLK